MVARVIAETASLLVTLQGNFKAGSSLERLEAWRGAARGSFDTIGGIGGEETDDWAAAGFLALLYWEEKVLKNETPIKI